MAEKMEGFVFKRRVAEEEYPWDQWEHGTWKVVKDVDFHVSYTTFVDRLRRRAAELKKYVRTQRWGDDAVVFEFYVDKRQL